MKLPDFATKLTNLFLIEVPRINNDFLSKYNVLLTPYKNVELVDANEKSVTTENFVKVLSNFELVDYSMLPFGQFPAMRLRVHDKILNDFK